MIGGASVKAPAGNRPEVFLYPAWRGQGVTLDAFGIQRDRYNIHGGGRVDDADGGVIVDYVVTFDSGLTNTHAWKFKPDTGDVVIARDLVTGQNARGRVTRDGFSWSTRARMRTAFGTRLCRVEVSYRISAPGSATTSVTIGLLGVPVATASAQIRHLEAAKTAEKVAAV
jgi:hypothetical protein